MKNIRRLLCVVCAVCVMLCGCTRVEERPSDTAFEPPVSAQTEPTEPSATEPPITEPPATEPPVTEPPEPEFYTVHMVCAGDNLIHSSIYNQAKRRAAANGGEGYDFGYVYERVEKYISSADLAILNQETIVTDKLEPSDYPKFCSPEDLGRHMVDIGFDVVSMSNNHVLDRGEEGLLYTLDFWDSQEGITRYGAYRDEADMENIRLRTVNGITFAFLGYMEHTNGLKLPEDSPCKITYLKELELIEQQIRRADELADVVVVSPHFGKEITNELTDNQITLAKKFADWGADIIIGTQPHTAQTMEYIEREDGTRAFCYYCLGNFVSAQSNPKALVGIIGELDIVKNSQTGEITLENPAAIPIITQYGGNFHQIHIVPYAEYTEEELNSHGARGEGFSQKSIDKVLSFLPEEYLKIS